jgi:hypothetical protein
MTAKNTAAHKTIGDLFSNEVSFVRLSWDFANDGGAVADTYRLATVGEKKLVVVNAVVHVETACTSTGSATVIIGVEGGDTDALLASTAVASLTDDAAFKTSAGQCLAVASGGHILMTIGTEALSAGKINVLLECVNVA